MPMMNHLDQLESESIHIFREIAAELNKPVLLYSMGKDSAVLLHLAQKAFAPGSLPFPLLHVDTTWKFREMIDYRDSIAAENDLELLVHTNDEGLQNNVTPFTHGSALYTDIMKTQALKQALDRYGFDAAIGGARRDEEKSRAKERIFSFRTPSHRWDPKAQRPELWNLYNTRLAARESVRVFPLSNWTELDIWRYIGRENIELVQLYFSKPRSIVKREKKLILVDDARFPLSDGEVPDFLPVRFRTLGCYPLTAATQSNATTVNEIISELVSSKLSEREGRLIDQDQNNSMERKKQDGYF